MWTEAVKMLVIERKAYRCKDLVEELRREFRF
jgi:hypothetical protein